MSNAAPASATTVFGPVGPIEVREQGSGRAVVMLPSLGRGGADFDDLASRLAAAGYRALCPEPRGIGGSTGELGDLTMADLADDVAAVIRERTEGTATLVGHAFGNRVVRMTATEHPELVERVALLCCGGMVPPPQRFMRLSSPFSTPTVQKRNTSKPSERRSSLRATIRSSGSTAGTGRSPPLRGWLTRGRQATTGGPQAGGTFWSSNRSTTWWPLPRMLVGSSRTSTSGRLWC